MVTLRIAAALLAAVLVVLNGCATSRGVPATQAPTPAATAAPPDAAYAVPENAVCMMKGSMPATIRFSVVGSVEGSKEFYGSVNEILPLMADEARKLGGDAIINLETHQRMGLWAWARPVGTGTAVKLANKSDLNCLAAGGTFH